MDTRYFQENLPHYFARRVTCYIQRKRRSAATIGNLWVRNGTASRATRKKRNAARNKKVSKDLIAKKLHYIRTL